MKLLAVPLLTALASPAYAGDEWRDEDTQREMLYLYVLAIDYVQTRQIIRECEAGTTRYEVNPLLPRCPSLSDLNTAIAITALGHVGISHVLSHRWRATFQWSTIAVHGAVVLHNFRIGLYGSF